MDVMYGVEVTASELEKVKEHFKFVAPNLDVTNSIYANHYVLAEEAYLLNELISAATNNILSFEVAYKAEGSRNSPTNRFMVAVKSTVINNVEHDYKRRDEHLMSEDIVNPSVEERDKLDDFIREFSLSKHPQFLIAL